MAVTMLMVRPLEERDSPALRAIVNAVIASGDAFIYERPMDDAGFGAWLGGWPSRWVAESDGHVVGGYVMRPNHPGRGSHVVNAAYMVDPAARGRGIGRALGEHSLAEARRLGYAAMQFNAVVASNEAAVATWRSLGFATIGTVPRGFRHAHGGFVDLLILHREL